MRVQGDVHVHMSGTASLSFVDGIRRHEGDVFEIACASFGLPLVNTLSVVTTSRVTTVRTH